MRIQVRPVAVAEEVDFKLRGNVVSFTERRLEAAGLYVILSERGQQRF